MMTTSTFAPPVVLYIDDKSEERREIGDKIKSFGYKVELAGTADEALTKFLTHRFLFDIIVIDLHLAGSIDGLQLTHKLKQLRFERGYTCRPELICLTAVWLSGADKNKVEDAGAQYIRKGFSENYKIALEAAMDRLKNSQKLGPKLIIRHNVPEPSRKLIPYRDRIILFDGTSAGASFATTAGPKPISGLGDVGLIFLDLFAFLSQERPKNWEDISKRASEIPFFSEQLAAVRRKHIITTRDGMKEINFRIRHALSASARVHDLGWNGADILVSYYRDPLTNQFIRQSDRKRSRHAVVSARKQVPSLAELLVEDKAAHLRLEADVYVEEMRG